MKLNEMAYSLKRYDALLELILDQLTEHYVKMLLVGSVGREIDTDLVQYLNTQGNKNSWTKSIQKNIRKLILALNSKVKAGNPDDIYKEMLEDYDNIIDVKLLDYFRKATSGASISWENQFNDFFYERDANDFRPLRDYITFLSAISSHSKYENMIGWMKELLES